MKWIEALVVIVLAISVYLRSFELLAKTRERGESLRERQGESVRPVKESTCYKQLTLATFPRNLNLNSLVQTLGEAAPISSSSSNPTSSSELVGGKQENSWE